MKLYPSIFGDFSDKYHRQGRSSLFGRITVTLALLAVTLLVGCVNDKTTRAALVSSPAVAQVSPPFHPDNDAILAHEPAWGLTECDGELEPSEVQQPATSLWSRLIAGYGFQNAEHPRIKKEMRRLSRHRASFSALVIM